MMKIKDVLNINNAKLITGNLEDNFDNFTYDTRLVKKNDTFLGLRGEKTNGSNFYQEAFKLGAKTCVVCGLAEDKIEECMGNIILVDDTLTFMIELAKRKRETLTIPIIAVTGSVGKTSTKNIIAQVLASKYKVLKTKGNLNTNIGLAITLLSLTDEEMVVLEMGMNRLGEISELSNIAKPNIAIINNIGTAHIGNLGSRENILKAKLEILEGLTGPIIINNDNDLLHEWAKTAKIKHPIITFGIDEESDYQALDIKYHNAGSAFKVHDQEIKINVLGRHFIYNSLVALIIADYYHIDKQNTLAKLNNLSLEKRRMELIKTDKVTIIDDTYNASYDSVYYALQVLSSFATRKIAVLGDILELGEYSQEIHTNIGSLINKNKIDILITIGSLAKYIHDKAIADGLKEAYHFANNNEAIDFINKIKKENDTILVKASHGMNFLEIVDNIKN